MSRNTLFLLCLAAVVPLFAAAAITSVQNSGSNIVAGLPNAGIAQGVIFVIKGSGLGPAQSRSLLPHSRARH